MSNALIRKLECFADLPADERAALVRMCADDVHRLPAGRDLIREGDRPDHVFVLIEGWACRYKLLSNGRRQILAYLIPGDLCDSHIFLLDRMDHGIGVMSPSRVAAVSPARLIETLDRHPAIERALWWATLVDAAIMREWMVNLGQRNAHERVAHLFYEMWLRLRAVGLAERGSFAWPTTQTELGDTLGLTPVHVNRTLQRLRAEGLIALEQRRLTILDPDRLAALCAFDPNYLHLGPATAPQPKRRGLTIAR